ncbi:MAG: hypothetical protein LUE06_10320 [Oscillospiraceae bacterium]|nr:hypothetical protein [Oscillospiraceae bacterium]
MHSRERPKQFLDIYNKPIIVITMPTALLSAQIGMKEC